MALAAGKLLYTFAHPHFEKLNYIDHACLDSIHNWRKQHEGQGSSLVVEWEELEERYRAPLGGLAEADSTLMPRTKAAAGNGR